MVGDAVADVRARPPLGAAADVPLSRGRPAPASAAAPRAPPRPLPGLHPQAACAARGPRRAAPARSRRPRPRPRAAQRRARPPGARGPGRSRPAGTVTGVRGPEDARREAELVARARDGDLDAFGRLVEAHGVRVLALVRRLGLSQHDAEDVAQEVFVRAWRSLPAFERRARL